MSAGTSTSQKRTGAIVALAVLGGLWAAPVGAQTGQVMPSPKFLAYDANGDPCNGCKLFAYVAGTTTKQDTYTSSTLGTPNANPVVLDSAGRATVFVDPTKSYKFTLAPASDTDPPGSPIWSVDNVVGPFSGVVTVTAANTRGVQISRSSADAGLSIASSGGSGKTYGIVSTTTGELQIRDDADGTPSLAFIGNNITAALTGTWTISGGLLSVTGAGAHTMSGGVTGGNTLTVRNTTAGATNYAGLTVGNDASASQGGLFGLSTAYTTTGLYTADGMTLESTRAGGLSIGASNASGAVRFYTGGNNARGAIDSSGRWGVGTTTPSFNLDVVSTADGVSGGLRIGRSDASYLVVNMDDGGASTAWASLQAGDGSAYRPIKLQPLGSVVLMPTQPAFLAYNSATDIGVLTGATVDFDTEVFDTAGNFASDTFTAPVAGTYEFCAAVDWTDGGTLAASLAFNISGTAYQFYRALTTAAGAASGCLIVSLTAGQTATVIINTADAMIDVEGGAAPRITWFSGRLLQ